MIIDAHVHVFPNQAGTAGYKDVETHLMVLRRFMEDAKMWRRMSSNTIDEKYTPYTDEDINFRVGKFGRYYWTKHGKECWLQRFPAIMVEMEWSPEQMIACMDESGVDKAVLQAEYMEPNYGREYFAKCVKKWPDRFIGTINIDYDINKSEEYRQCELKKMRDSVLKDGMRGVYQGYPRQQKADDDKFDPLWAEMSNLKIPHIFWTGFTAKREYLGSLNSIITVLKKFPNLNVVITHLGGNIKPPSDPNYTDTPNELLSLLKLPNTYFEIGYILAFQNWAVWKENSEYPYPLHNKIIKRVYDEVGAERLLFGSDIPNLYRMCTYKQCLDVIRLHFDFLSEEERNLVLGGNAARLYRISA